MQVVEHVNELHVRMFQLYILIVQVFPKQPKSNSVKIYGRLPAPTCLRFVLPAAASYVDPWGSSVVTNCRAIFTLARDWVSGTALHLHIRKADGAVYASPLALEYKMSMACTRHWSRASRQSSAWLHLSTQFEPRCGRGFRRVMPYAV